MRGSGVLFHLLSGLLLFAVLRRRFGPLPAFAGMALVYFHPAIIAAIRSARMDALAMALGCGSLLAMDRLAESARRPWGLLAGLLMGLAILTHPAVAAMVPAAIWLARSPRHPSYGRWAGDLVIFAASASVPLVPWFVYITIIDPGAYQVQLGAAMELFKHHEIPKPLLWLQRVQELAEGFRFFLAGALSVLAGLAVSAFIKRLRPLFLVAAGALVFHIFLMRGTTLGQIHVIVAMTFPLAASLKELGERAIHVPRRKTAFVVLSVLFLVNGLSVPAARAFAIIGQYESRSPAEFARQWRAAIPARATVAGPIQSFYVSIQHNGNYRPIRQLFPGGNPKSHWCVEALCRARLDYVVVPVGSRLSDVLAANCLGDYTLASQIRLPRAPIEGLQVESYDSDIYKRQVAQSGEPDSQRQVR